MYRLRHNAVDLQPTQLVSDSTKLLAKVAGLRPKQQVKKHNEPDDQRQPISVITSNKLYETIKYKLHLFLIRH